MITEFKTIATEGEGLFKDRGSKFLGFTFHVTNEEEIKVAQEQLRKDYHDARHHCYAYVLGVDRKNYRANDDGEPSHSAGDPILGQLNSNELTNTLVIVIRYFGGTKLGVSGLINAYRTAAELAIQNSRIITEVVKKQLELSYSYEATSEVMRVIDDFSIEIVDQQFQEKCLLKGKIRVDKVDQLETKVQLLNDLGAVVSLKI